MIWNRLMWGIEFKPNAGESMLIGSLWLDHAQHPYEGEPSRALLFTTRTKARKYCRDQHAKYAGRSDCCGQWLFTPVRVRETVRKI